MNRYYYFKIYSKDHIPKDYEIHKYSNVTYKKTLNGTGDLSFTIPAEYYKQENMDIIAGYHIELITVQGDKESCLWWGVVVNPSNDGTNINIIAYGYMHLLTARLFRKLFMSIYSPNKALEKTYYDKTYGQLISTLIDDINNDTFTGVSIGTIQDTSLKTTRIIKWNDDLKEKIDEFIEACKCYCNVDRDRKFNFYKEFGTDKSGYCEVNDFNIVNTSNCIVDYSNIYNRIYAINEYHDDEKDIDVCLSSIKEDTTSINLYGLREKELSVNDLRLQETIDEYTQNELDLYSTPAISMSLEVAISDTFNIFDIDVGDIILLDSNKLNYHGKIRLLEYTVDITKYTVQIVIGNTLIKENEAYKKYRY